MSGQCFLYGDRLLPRAPLPIIKCYFIIVWCQASNQKALPFLHGSYGLMRQTKTLSLPTVIPWPESLCSLLQVSAGNWPFPSLSLQSIYGCLDPYPAMIFQCLCPFLPGKHRSHDIGYPNLNKIQTFFKDAWYLEVWTKKGLDFILHFFIDLTPQNSASPPFAFFHFFDTFLSFSSSSVARAFNSCSMVISIYTIVVCNCSCPKRNLYDIHTVFQPVRGLSMPQLMSMKIHWHFITHFMRGSGMFFQLLVYCSLTHFSMWSGIPWIKNISAWIWSVTMKLFQIFF